MFERFTKSAREVVIRAQAEGRALGHERIGIADLLLAVAAGDGRAARVLADHGATHEVLRARAAGTAIDGEARAAIGIDLDEIRRRAEAAFGPGALERGHRRRRGVRRRARHLRFTAPAKNALELALREALAAGDNHIGAEHVLLGLLRDEKAEAVAVLRRTGAPVGAVRDALRPAAKGR
jgi:Clp amino terminal domain, pathogenicity island component